MLPEALSRERDRVACMSFMGLLPEIDHAWMTVDNVLYLWNYHTQDFTQFRDLEQASVDGRMRNLDRLPGLRKKDKATHLWTAPAYNPAEPVLELAKE